MARQASTRIRKLEASAGFEPAVEVLQPAAWRSAEFTEVHCVFADAFERSSGFILVRQSSAALPSPLPSNRLADGVRAQRRAIPQAPNSRSDRLIAHGAGWLGYR